MSPGGDGIKPARLCFPPPTINGGPELERVGGWEITSLDQAGRPPRPGASPAPPDR